MLRDHYKNLRNESDQVILQLKELEKKQEELDNRRLRLSEQMMSVLKKIFKEEKILSKHPWKALDDNETLRCKVSYKEFTELHPFIEANTSLFLGNFDIYTYNNRVEIFECSTNIEGLLIILREYGIVLDS